MIIMRASFKLIENAVTKVVPGKALVCVGAAARRVGTVRLVNLTDAGVSAGRDESDSVPGHRDASALAGQ